MKRTLLFLLVASFFLISPAVASAARGGGRGEGQMTVTRERVVVYQTSSQRDDHYHRSDHRDFRRMGNYYRSVRHAPAYGYYKKHRPYHHQPSNVVRHHAPAPVSTVIIGVPGVFIRLGF